MLRVLIIMALLSLTACTHTLTPVCRHTAMFTAVTACETMPVRMAVGETANGTMHVEAQVWDEGRWRYVDSVTLETVDYPNMAFTVCGYEPVTDFFDMQFRPFIERFEMEKK